MLKLLFPCSLLHFFFCFVLLAQKRIRETRKAVMHEPTRNLETDNADDGAEFEFWKELRDICLLPEQAAFNQSG